MGRTIATYRVQLETIRGQWITQTRTSPQVVRKQVENLFQHAQETSDAASFWGLGSPDKFLFSMLFTTHKRLAVLEQGNSSDQ